MQCSIISIYIDGRFVVRADVRTRSSIERMLAPILFRNPLKSGKCESWLIFVIRICSNTALRILLIFFFRVSNKNGKF